MFFSADDEEQDFMSPGGSKLANLFGMDKASGNSGNESLTYTAPKQPKKKEAAPEGGAPAVVVASVVHAYKYVDNKYASQGKLGAALLANHTTKDYRILLYINKQQQVTNAKISPAFTFNVQQNNYASFYDDARQTWSVMFDSADAAEKFAKEMAVAKANSATGPLTELIQQDLALGEGGPLEAGDSVQVKYTGWLLSRGTFGKVFDQSAGDNFFRFKVGKGKVIKGWDQGMLGMKKGGKRLLVIPPSLAYGSQGVADRIPPESTLIFEVTVMKVKLQKGESPQESPAPTPAPTPAVTVPDQNDMEEVGVKGRTKSINEQLSHAPGDSNKAKLISRMAKMGQPMLPLQGAVAAGPEDSDEEMHQHVEQHVDPALRASPKPNVPSKPGVAPGGGAHVIITQAQPTAIHQGVSMIDGQPVMVGTSAGMMQPQPQQQPAFLQNLPGAQQMSVYQNPNTFLQQQQQQQQQAALLQQQQQLLQQQQQQQLLGQGIPGTLGATPTSFGVPSTYSAPGMPAPQSTTTSSSSTDSLAPVLLTETRQQNTEVRMGMSKMSDKVDKILEKLEHMGASGMAPGAQGMGMMTPYGGLPAPSMEANVLMQNITRIVQENERLKKEVYEQSNKVHEQNEKIANLLEKNQKYVEQSQNLLEQRNEGYKNTASQSQARVLSLEQEKVQLSTELSSASAQISTLQLELGDYRKREGELKQQLQMNSSVSSSTKEELDRLRIQKEDDDQKIATLSESIRDQKLARKSVEAKLSGYLEELADLKASNETLEKNLSERKRKVAEERRKMEEDIEDAKISYEQTIEGLREKLRKQKTSVDVETESKVSKIEEEISREWQTKCDRMMAATTEKHNRQVADMKEEKEELTRKVEELEKKLVAVRSSGSSTEQQISQLQDELAEMKIWQDKYNNLRSQASTMKERYEKRIEELEGEKEEEEEQKNEVVEKARKQRQEFQQQIQQLQEEVQQLRTQSSVTGGSVQQNAPSGSSSADVATEVKKIMNSVFQSLRGEFDAEETYQGSEVLATILNAIKQTTLQLVNKASANQEESEDEEEEEEEDEEAEEEEEGKEKEGVDEVDEDEEEEDGENEKEEKGKDETDIPDNQSDAQPEVKAEPSLAESSVPEKVNLSEEATQQMAADVAVNGKEDPSMPLDKNSDVLPSEASPLPSQPPSLKGEENENNLNKNKIDEVDGEADKIGDNRANGIQDEAQTEDKEKTNVADDVEKEGEINSNNKQESDSPLSSMDGDSSQLAKKEADSVPSEETNGVTTPPSPAKKSAEESKETTENKKASLEAATATAFKGSPTSDPIEPPPLFDDDDEDEEDSPLFGKDNTVTDTLGSGFEPKPTPKPEVASEKGKATPAKKLDLVNDEDLKPQPPPPLFGDDSDEDDLDWLS